MRPRAFIVVAVLALGGCDAKSPTTPGLATGVSRVEVLGDGSFHALNEVHQLVARATLMNAPASDVTARSTWQSSNEGVVTVSDKGEARSIGPGEASITADYQGERGTLAVTVLAAGTHLLSGKVTAKGGFPLQGASVEIVHGPSSGLSTVAQAGGVYRFLGVSGNVTVRAAENGYVAETKSASVVTDTVLDFALQPAAGQLAGTYDVSFTASASCTQLPDWARHRTFLGALTQNDGTLGLQVMVAQDQPVFTFYGSIDGKNVGFTFQGPCLSSGGKV